MCGLAGYYSHDGFFSGEDLDSMTTALRHRGPDAEGFFHDEYCGLGHTRLSIIDLSSRANQPMTSANERYMIIYNGEIYNFREIGARLKLPVSATGPAHLKTSSDTEVILESFVQNGVDFVQQLNGMFVIVIYDKLSQELYLFRDRIGIKPLYYFWDGKNFAFASELKSLKLLDQIDKKINKSSIDNFLHLGYIPAPLSIYEKIYKMPAGSWMKLSRNGLETQKYWSLRNALSNKVIEEPEEALVKLSDLIISSVQYQLKSDVPFGVFLSGGIDSSLVTAQAVGLSIVKVNTFSIGFEENSHNESEYAKAVAKYLGTDHHEFIVSYKDAIDLIASILDTYDEPFADASAIPTMLVSKLAKQHVTVTLSGEGGDELFYGYGAYKWAQNLNNPFFSALRKPAAEIFSHMASRYQRVGKLLDYDNEVYLKSHIFSQEQYLFSEAELKKILTSDYYLKDALDHLKIATNAVANADVFVAGQNSLKERKLNAMEQQALFDLTYYLQDDLLTKVDRASMRYSIETRVPYLDHRVIEFAINLSPKLKYKNGISKYILKKILYQYIPPELFDRPKQGFAIPLNKWLHHELNYLIEDNLNKSVIEKYNVVNFEEVQSLITGFRNGKDYLFNRLWLLIILHMWLIKNS